MSDSEQNFDSQLQDLYQQRKRAHKAPSRIKKHVLLKAKRNARKSESSPWMNAAALAATLIICVWFAVNVPVNEPSPDNVALVEFHSLSGENKSGDNPVDRVFEYAKLQKDFQNSRNKKLAPPQIAEIMTIDEDEWLLKTCNNELLRVSSELIASLSEQQLVTPDLNSGEAVMLALNDEGYILDIRRQENLSVCE